MRNVGGVGKAMTESRKGYADSLVSLCMRWLDGRLINANVILNGTIHTGAANLSLTELKYLRAHLGWIQYAYCF